MRKWVSIIIISFILACAVIYAHKHLQGKSEPTVIPPGQPNSMETKTLSLGAKVLQNHSPLADFNIYIMAFHPVKNDVDHQMEAHHYCKQVNEDFMQCILFDSNTRNANLNGIEYIISEKLYKTLPPEERKYWHPHNYEILSGQLIAPGIPDKVEKRMLTKKMNGYGKTWHVWMTGAQGMKGDNLPLGDPSLAWSFNHDGELKPQLQESRDKHLKVSTDKKRQERQDLIKLAEPQSGVDAVADKFKAPTQAIPGVVDADKLDKSSAKQ